MANVKLFDQTGKEVSTVELNDAIFGIEPNESVVFDVVISQRASLRQGTHAVKTVQQYQVVDVNHGVKKELDVLVKVLSALHNGVVVELSSDQLHVAMRTNFLKKFVALHLNLFTQKKLLKTNL